LAELTQTSFDALDPRSAHILRLRFGLIDDREHTFEEIGVLYGVTRQRAEQIASKALKKLRLSPYLPKFREFYSS
jgi:RNA polymerase primary sigma factor